MAVAPLCLNEVRNIDRRHRAGYVCLQRAIPAAYRTSDLRLMGAAFNMDDIIQPFGIVILDSLGENNSRQVD